MQRGGVAHHHRNVARNIWTAKTIISMNAETLLEDLPVLKQDPDNTTAVLFNISRNTPPNVLSPLVKSFQDLPFPAIGCLSHGHDGSNPPYMLSYALHKASDSVLEMVVPFRSSIKGTPKIALGREVSQLEKNVHSTEWAGDSAVVPEALPEELRKLRYVTLSHALVPRLAKNWTYRPGLISHLIYFANDEPQGLMKSLDYRLPNTTRVSRFCGQFSSYTISDYPSDLKGTQIGSIAAATPFATGRPYTLVSGPDIYSDGAVGIAFCRSPNPFTGLAGVKLDYGKLSPLGDSLEVTS